MERVAGSTYPTNLALELERDAEQDWPARRDREGTMDQDDRPSSLQQPFWLGKAQRHHVLLKFITICVVVALLFLGVIILASQ
jgi:hypothetical protein